MNQPLECITNNKANAIVHISLSNSSGIPLFKILRKTLDFGKPFAVFL